MGKRMARMLRETILPQLRIFLAQQSAQQANYSSILVMSDDPDNLSIAVALFVLCMWYDENGEFFSFTRLFCQEKLIKSHKLGTLCIRKTPTLEIDKHYIRQRLAWITSNMGEHGNVSRANLNAVNAVLIQRP